MLKIGPAEADVEGAVGGAGDVELVQHAALTLEFGALLVLFAWGSLHHLGLRRPHHGGGWHGGPSLGRRDPGRKPLRRGTLGLGRPA